RLVDPIAAVVDIGALSLPLLGLLSGLAYIAISHWLLGLIWPVFRDFRKHHFEPIFKSLRPWQKIILYLCCFFLLLYVFVACLAAGCGRPGGRPIGVDPGGRRVAQWGTLVELSLAQLRAGRHCSGSPGLNWVSGKLPGTTMADGWRSTCA